MFDKSLCHLGNVHQTVLMYTDIYKCTEINNITDSSLQHHSFFQIFHFKNVWTKDRFRHVITRVTGRFLQFFHNITKCNLTDSQFCCHLLIVFYLQGKSKEISCHNIIWLISKFWKKCRCCFIALRMYTCCIQRILSTGNTHETCTLFKCLRS